MKTYDYINYTIDHLFTTNNDRQLLKAFFYRVTLNWTPRQVGRELGLSRNQVNQLNTARLLKLSIDSKDEVFKKNYKEARKTIGNYATHKLMRNQLRGVRGVKNRLTFKYDVLIAKQELC